MKLFLNSLFVYLKDFEVLLTRKPLSVLVTMAMLLSWPLPDGPPTSAALTVGGVHVCLAVSGGYLRSIVCKSVCKGVWIAEPVSIISITIPTSFAASPTIQMSPREERINGIHWSLRPDLYNKNLCMCPHTNIYSESIIMWWWYDFNQTIMQYKSNYIDCPICKDIKQLWYMVLSVCAVSMHSM